MATFHGPVLQCEYTVKIKKRQYAGNGVGDKGRIWCDWRGAQHVDWASLGEPHRTWKNGNFNGPLDIIFACCIALWSHIIICALYRSWCLARELEPGVCTCGTCGTKWYTCSTQSTSLSADQLWALHGAFLEKLHDALGVCCDEMFSGWGEPFHNYTEHYCALDHGPAER